MKTQSIIEQAIRDCVKGAIALGEMGDADEKYLVAVLAPGAADLAMSRMRQAERIEAEKAKRIMAVK
jgi:hypothetical protein